MNDAILAHIDASWHELLPVFDGLSEQQAGQPGVCGYYSVKDLAAHLAWWEEHTRQAVAAGIHESIDVDAQNDLIFAANKETSFAELKERLIDGHARAVETFASVPNLSDDDVKDDTWEHYDEHGAQIRVWRIANGL